MFHFGNQILTSIWVTFKGKKNVERDGGKVERLENYSSQYYCQLAMTGIQYYFSVFTWPFTCLGLTRSTLPFSNFNHGITGKNQDSMTLICLLYRIVSFQVGSSYSISFVTSSLLC